MLALHSEAISSTQVRSSWMPTETSGKSALEVERRGQSTKRDGGLPFSTHPIYTILLPVAHFVFPGFVICGGQTKGWSWAGNQRRGAALLQTRSTSTGRRHRRADHHPLSQPFANTFSRLSSCHYEFKI